MKYSHEVQTLPSASLGSVAPGKINWAKKIQNNYIFDPGLIHIWNMCNTKQRNNTKHRAGPWYSALWWKHSQLWGTTPSREPVHDTALYGENAHGSEEQHQTEIQSMIQRSMVKTHTALRNQAEIQSMIQRGLQSCVAFIKQLQQQHNIINFLILF